MQSILFYYSHMKIETFNYFPVNRIISIESLTQ